MEDRSGSWVNVMPTACASPGLALLLGRIALEDPAAIAPRAMGVFAVRRVAGAPKMLQAGHIVGKVRQELGDRVVGG
jgi:hypothetical protein